MSVLQTPRILFRGEISWDPITTNNYDSFYDENTDTTVFPTEQDRVAAFRKQAIDAVSTKGSWNPHGTYRSSFYDTYVSGVDLGSGVSTNDPFVKSNASLLGMLIDLEPYGAFSSQLFFDHIEFGVRGGYSVFCERHSRIHDRYVNFSRNPANSMIAGVASVVWQTSFPREFVRVSPFDSPALQALMAAMNDPDVLGLTVRFNTYRTVYYDNLELTNKSPLTAQAAQALTNKLKTGGFQPNPARSLLVGVLGLWRRGEPAHEPGDRTLLSKGNAPAIATAQARVDSNSLTLDLSNSVVMTSKSADIADVGTLSVAAVDPVSGTSTPLGDIHYSSYNKAAFEAASGLVVLPLSDSQASAAQTGNLTLSYGKDKWVGTLTEAPLRAIPVSPNVYSDFHDTATIAFQVYNRGVPATGAQALTMYEMSADGSTVTNTTNVTTDAQGLYAFQVTGASSSGPEGNPGRIVAYVAAPDATQAPSSSSGINPLINTYAYLRILAADDDIAALPPTWENVYKEVLANWNAIAPCMDNWLMLNDPVQVKVYAPIIKRLTDPSRFESYRYMPVTRDLTPGCRALLYKFLDATPDKLEGVASAETASAETAHSPNFAHLGRALRCP